MARVKQNPAENFNKPLAVRLRALIDESGHSKADLGKEIGVSRQAINDYTLGNSVPDANNLLKLAKYFGVTSDYLLGLEPQRYSGTVPYWFFTYSKISSRFNHFTSQLLYFINLLIVLFVFINRQDISPAFLYIITLFLGSHNAIHLIFTF